VVASISLEKKWHRKAIMISLYHNKMLLKNPKWTLRKTAKRLDMSIGTISESLKLAKAIMENPEIEKMKRQDALRSIR
jgi:hypothetical protein